MSDYDIHASSFGDRDFSKAFDNCASGEIANAYRTYVDESELSDGTDEEQNAKRFQALRSIYEKDRIAQKIVKIPVDDAIYNWRTTSSEVINNFDEDNHASQAFIKAGKDARLFGISAIVPIFVDSQGKKLTLNRPLEEIISEGAIFKAFHIATENLTLSGEIQKDILSPQYGMPKRIKVGKLVTDPSRIILIKDTPNFFNSVIGDLSEYHEAKTRLSGAVRRNLAIILTTDAQKISQSIKAIEAATGAKKDFNETLSYRARALFDNLNDINVAVLNSGETLQFFEKSNIKDLITNVELQMKVLSGVSDVSITRLFTKIGSSSLGDSSQSELDNYSQALETLISDLFGDSLIAYDEFLKTVLKIESFTSTWNPTRAEALRNAAVGE